MTTYTQITYQIIWAVKHREGLMRGFERRTRLYGYLRGILEQKRCHVYEIGGVEDHLHIVTSVAPSIALATLVKELKLAAHRYIADAGLWPDFTSRQTGYAAFTYSASARPGLIAYVANQELHHRRYSSRTELAALLTEHGVAYDEHYFK